MDQIDQAIDKANRGLNRITIERRGRTLALRGSLPTQPGEGRGNKRRYVYLGVFANPEGVKVALAKAQRLESDLNMDRFNWADWQGSSSGVTVEKTAAEWAKEFGVIKAGAIKSGSFDSNYAGPLGSLPDKPLTEELLIAHVLGRSKANSWDRKNDCMVFGQLAKFAGLQVDFGAIRGKYEPRPVNSDDLPSDEDIEHIQQNISHPGWRWVYGMLAVYGLRPHEIFKIADYEGIGTDTGKITILDDSKTGRRDVWPLPDKWRHDFNLAQVVMPNVNLEGCDNKQIGRKVSKNLKRYKVVSHIPYALRHAWAIRSAVMGVADSIAARWMGHSVAIHSKTYHSAINQLQHESIWRKANQSVG
jgi:hypothetical protein